MNDSIFNMTFEFLYFSYSTNDQQNFLTIINTFWQTMRMFVAIISFRRTKILQRWNLSTNVSIANCLIFESISNTRLICWKIVETIWQNFVFVCTMNNNTNTWCNELSFAWFFTTFFWFSMIYKTLKTIDELKKKKHEKILLIIQTKQTRIDINKRKILKNIVFDVKFSTSF